MRLIDVNFPAIACCNLMIFFSQITNDGQNIQQQVNGYSPKFGKNQRFRLSKMGGYSPKNVAEYASFSQVGGYRPKSNAADAKNALKTLILYCFWAII